MNITELRNEIRLEAPGVTNQLIDVASLRAARDLLRRAPIWKRDVLLWPIPERPCYSLKIPAETEIGDIISVTYLDRLIEPTTGAMLARTNKMWEVQTGSTLTNYLRPDLGSIRLYPIPDNTVNQENSVTVKVSLIPSLEADEIDDAIADTYRDTFIHGALAWLLSKPGQKWYAPNVAAEHNAYFYYGMAQALIDDSHSNVRSELSVAMRPFA